MEVNDTQTQNKKEAEQSPPKKISSLVEFHRSLSSTVPIVVDFREDVIEIDVRILSAQEWMTLDHAVPYPPKVQKTLTATGPVYDINDNGYQQALRDRNDRVAAKRLSACLQVQMEGETNDDRATWLMATFPHGLLTALYTAILKLHDEGEATILHRRDSFPANGNRPPTRDGETAPDA